MSEKEKDMIAKIAAMPEQLQEKFRDKIDGATMALDMLGQTRKEKEGASNEP